MSQLRNVIHPEEHEPEYLLRARFHDDELDEGGYVTTVWTPREVLETIEDPYKELAECVRVHQLSAEFSFHVTFGDGPIPQGSSRFEGPSLPTQTQTQ